MFGISGILNILLGASLSPMLGQIKVIQLVIFAMGLNLLFPINLVQFNQMFIGICMVEFLPSDQIIGALFTISESDAPNERLEMLSMESENFLVNGGSMLIFFFLWFSALTLTSALTFGLSYTSKAQKLKSVIAWIDAKLKWNIIFDLIFASQIELLLAAVI